MATMQVELVSPESIVFSGEATMVVARTTSGEIAFLPGHVPFVGVLSGKSPVRIMMTDGTTRVVAVHSGFVEVSHNTVTILSDVAEQAEETLHRAGDKVLRIPGSGCAHTGQISASIRSPRRNRFPCHRSR